MSVEETRTATPEETESVAADVARRLVPGDIVLLGGEMGTGKTTFVRGAARALGVQSAITSPTYTIGNIYDGANFEIAHLDLYRLESVGVSDEATIADFVTPERVSFIEWPHDQFDTLPGLRATVTLTHSGEDARVLAVHWLGGEASGFEAVEDSGEVS